MIQCPNCHTGNPDNSKFCNQCATSLGGPRPAQASARARDGAVSQGNDNQTVGKGGLLVDGHVGGDVLGAGAKKEVHYHGPAGSDPAALHNAYLGYVYESASQLALAGIDRKAASESETRLNLGCVYTALLTLTSETPEALVPGRSHQEGGEEPRRLSALEQLNRHPRLVLLGDPGSGKSTFVNFTALCLAGAALGREPGLAALAAPLPAEDDERPPAQDPKTRPQPWNHGPLLPVRVVLRDFAARGLPPAGHKASARHLWDFIAAELAACCLDEYAAVLRTRLLEQGGLLLLDGLDEVPEAHQRRAQIKAAVEDFAAAYPRCRILVTSRTYAYQKQDWRLAAFQEAVLAPFSRGQIRQFVARWYEHIAALRGLNRDDARGRAAVLQRAIFASSRLLGLAERPLLLTLMASLHAWRGGSLPEKREELYADTVDLLLDWWERPKIVRSTGGESVAQQPSLAEWLKVDRARVRALLNELAFKAHGSQPLSLPGTAPETTGTADIPEGELVTGLMRLSENPEINPAQLVEFLTARAGLLLPRGVGVYTFPHRTFQEYLAACHLTDHGYPDEAARLARQEPNRWREVVLLAGAKAARGGAFALWPLVDALCGREPSDHASAADLWGALLAGQAIGENAGLAALSESNQEKAARVSRWQVYILKRDALSSLERVQAGNTLAVLGDPRFDPEHFCLPGEAFFGFVRVPAGKFVMGSDVAKDKDARARECPQHELDLAEFWMGRYPVTVAQYRAFVDASGYEISDRSSLSGPANHPAVYITWYDALAYCQWLEAQLGALARQEAFMAGLSAAEQDFWQGMAAEQWRITLPSEAEWEKAARGVNGPLYPWGDEFIPRKANTQEIGVGGTSAVGCFAGGASLYGVLDMSGNAWEWTRSLWGKDWENPEFKYPYDPRDGRENLAEPREIPRVLRGGSFFNDHRFPRCAYRLRNRPDNRLAHYGFRLSVSPR